MTIDVILFGVYNNVRQLTKNLNSKDLTMQPQTKSILFSILFLTGIFLVFTANLKISTGMLLMVIGYNEFRNFGLAQRVLAEIRDALDGDDEDDETPVSEE